jgi:hypothetical protein
MLPKYHILFNFLVVFALKLITNISNAYLGIIFLSSFLIDMDHYLLYAIKKKDINLEAAYQWFIERKEEYFKMSIEERKKFKQIIMVFHTLEFWILLFALSFISQIFLFILAGIMLHLIFDWIELFILKEPIYPKFSLIWTLIKNKNKEAFYF